MDSLFSKQVKNSWANIISKDILKEIKVELNDNVFPKKEDIFRCFKLTPIENVKVVILGQDPYPTRRNATGLSFSLPEGVKIAPSMRNILAELPKERSQDLTDWANEGVLLLNSALTVMEGSPNSHKDIWLKFTNHIIDLINQNCDYVIFCAWGRNAQSLTYSVDKTKHTVIQLSHPSPLGATKRAPVPFKGSNVFENINTIRELHNKEKIKWIPE